MSIGGGTGFVFKLDEKFEVLRYSTFLNAFNPVRVLPHPAGGHWVVGSGSFDESHAIGSVADIAIQRLVSSPVEPPRIDWVAANVVYSPLSPGGTAVVAGEGFTGDTVVYFGDLPLAPRNVTGARMEVLLPPTLARGLMDVTVRTGERRSAPVRVRVF